MRLTVRSSVMKAFPTLCLEGPGDCKIMREGHVKI